MSRDLRLPRLVKKTKPRASEYWIRTIRLEGRPSAPTVVSAAAFIYLDPYGRVGSEFIYVSGASVQPIIQVRLETLMPNPLDEANIGSAVKSVAPQVNPVADDLGSAEYRREMAQVVVQQALLECMELLK